MTRVLVLASLCALARPAAPCTCPGAADEFVSAWPKPDTAHVPANVHPLLTVGSAAQVVTAELRISGKPVASRVAKIAREWELVPEHALPEGSDVEVVVTRGDGAATAVGRFHVSDGEDRRVPSGGAIVKSGYFAPKDCGECCWGRPWGEAMVSVDATTAGFVVWTAADAGRIDYGTAPSLLVRPDMMWIAPKGPAVTRVVLGTTAMSCGVPTYTFPDKTRRLRVGVKARTSAGVLGPAHEVVLDLAHPSPGMGL